MGTQCTVEPGGATTAAMGPQYTVQPCSCSCGCRCYFRCAAVVVAAVGSVVFMVENKVKPPKLEQEVDYTSSTKLNVLLAVIVQK